MNVTVHCQKTGRTATTTHFLFFQNKTGTFTSLELLSTQSNRRMFYCEDWPFRPHQPAEVTLTQRESSPPGLDAASTSYCNLSNRPVSMQPTTSAFRQQPPTSSTQLCRQKHDACCDISVKRCVKMRLRNLVLVHHSCDKVCCFARDDAIISAVYFGPGMANVTKSSQISRTDRKVCNCRLALSHAYLLSCIC